MKTVKIMAAVAGVLVCGALSSSADVLQLSVFPPVAISSVEDDITGLRLSLYGKNQNVSGVDLGLVNKTSEDFAGFGMGIVNIVHGNAKGVHLNPYGAGLIDGDFSGLNWGGFYTSIDQQMTGVQISFVTRARMVKGVQLGFVNVADDMVGVQIGLANIIKANKYIKICPIVNARF